METCLKCNSAVNAGTQFCSSCGNNLTATPAVALITTAQQQSLAPPPVLYHVGYATGQVRGPLTHEAVLALIARQEIKITDSIAVDRSNSWTPITQSPFATFVAGQASIDRLASSTCPRCGSAMAVVLRKPRIGYVLLAIGIFTSVALIGIPLLIAGFIMLRKTKAAYQCPRCNFKTG